MIHETEAKSLNVMKIKVSEYGETLIEALKSLGRGSG